MATKHASGALDEVDRAIIEHLQADGRMPYTRLAAAVGEGTHAVLAPASGCARFIDSISAI